MIDENRSLHISYPRTKLVETYLFTHKKRNPLVIRPNLNLKERERFVDELKESSLGKRYDSYRVV